MEYVCEKSPYNRLWLHDNKKRVTSRAHVCEALKNVKMGKAPGMYAVCGEMLKYGEQAEG